MNTVSKLDQHVSNHAHRNDYCLVSELDQQVSHNASRNDYCLIGNEYCLKES